MTDLLTATHDYNTLPEQFLHFGVGSADAGLDTYKRIWLGHQWITDHQFNYHRSPTNAWTMGLLGSKEKLVHDRSESNAAGTYSNRF